MFRRRGPQRAVACRAFGVATNLQTLRAGIANNDGVAMSSTAQGDFGVSNCTLRFRMGIENDNMD